MTAWQGITVPAAFVVFSDLKVRPANATAYVSGQLVANSVTAANVSPFVFLGLPGRADSPGFCSLNRCRIRKTSTVLTNASFRVHFYSSNPVTVTPPSPVNGDGGAWLTPIDKYIGAMDVTCDRAFTNGSEGAGVPLVGSSVILTLPAGGDLYALIEARAAYTPVTGEQFQLVLEGFRY